jgi:hypothetical protein
MCVCKNLSSYNKFSLYGLKNRREYKEKGGSKNYIHFYSPLFSIGTGLMLIFNKLYKFLTVQEILL